MNGEEILAISGLAGGGLIAFAHRKLMNRADRRRIADDVKKHRGRILSCKWSLGWNFTMFFDGERYYEVTYETNSGDVFGVVAKTGMFTGVCYRDDTKTALNHQGTR
jgi:hypothetical protein